MQQCRYTYKDSEYGREKKKKEWGGQKTVEKAAAGENRP